MSGSNRRNISEAFGPAVIIAGVAFWAAMIWDISAQYSARRVNAEHYASEYASNAPEYIDGACAGAEGPRLRECIAERVEASHENQRGEQDLRAQQDMADWAFWMMLVSAVTMVLTAVALWFVKGTLDATRQAVEDTSNATEAMREANTIADRIGKAQVRAYLSVTVNRFTLDAEGWFDFVFNVTNSGQSPARNVYVNLEVARHDSGKRAGGSTRVRALGDIASGENRIAWDEVDLTPNLRKKLAGKLSNFIVTVRTTHDSVFGEKAIPEVFVFEAFAHDLGKLVMRSKHEGPIQMRSGGRKRGSKRPEEA